MRSTFPSSSVEDAGVTLVAVGTTPLDMKKFSRRLVGSGVAYVVLALRLSEVSPVDGEGPS
jgi:hypothetical protein